MRGRSVHECARVRAGTLHTAAYMNVQVKRGKRYFVSFIIYRMAAFYANSFTDVGVAFLELHDMRMHTMHTSCLSNTVSACYTFMPCSGL